MYGFVYIWYDRKHHRYYIGSHAGELDDGYVCSSSWMKSAYSRRKHDFKRRILEVIEEDDRKKLLLAEQKWLDLIDDSELGKRYYNLKKNAFGGFTQEAHTARILKYSGVPLSETHRSNISTSLAEKPWSEQRRSAQTGTYDNTNRQLTYEHAGVKIGNLAEAMKYSGKTRKTLDRWCDEKSPYHRKEWRRYRE